MPKSSHQPVSGISIAILVLTTTFLLTLAARAQIVSADFGNRSAGAVVPAGFMGAGQIGSSMKDISAMTTLKNAGISETRFWINFYQVYAKSTPDFVFLDNEISRMRLVGIHPIAVLSGTPPSLGPQNCSAPSDNQAWARMAATIVGHINKLYPGFIQDYEIWNEPDNTKTLCVADPTARLNTYLGLYAAVGSALRVQAQADGQVIHIGGPALASPHTNAKPWLQALLSNISTAPYVDFVTFHLYLTGQTEINNGMTWPQLYAITQATNGGFAYYYKLVEGLVRAGHQPNAATTPIYITEYNDNWAFAKDCCRNDPAYGSLWNSLVLSDTLNSVYTGASRNPDKINYFAAGSAYFCVLGQWNSAMDCNRSAFTPYPQFYAFELFTSPAFLNLEAGAHMAVSVSPNSTTQGLTATAFYTDGADNVVIVNPTDVSYPAVQVDLKNTGLQMPFPTTYLLNDQNSEIASSVPALTALSDGYSAQVGVPAYSTVAVSIAGSPAPPVPVPSADIQLSLESLPELAVQGDLLTYTFRIWNVSGIPADLEILTTQVPQGTTFDYLRISGTPGLSTCSHPAFGSTGPIICHENASMAANSTWTVRLTVQVTAPSGTVISESGVASQLLPEQNLSNNQAAVSMTVQ